MSKRIILSIAHSRVRKGAGWEGVYEWDLSKVITPKVVEQLHEQGVDAWLVEGESLTRDKIPRVNELAKGHDALALEIHFNNAGSEETHIPKGSCVLHYPTSSKGKAAAETMLTHLLRLGRGKHWRGVIPIPGEYRDADLVFLSKTTCPAILLEVETIREQMWVSEDVERIVEVIVDGLVELFQGNP